MRTTRTNDYFSPPHGGRPPSDAAVREATRRYVEQERAQIAATMKGPPGETKEKE